MKTSEAIDALFVALIEFQAELKTIPRTKTVKVSGNKGSYEFRYAPLDAIMENIVPLLQKQGLAIAQAVDQDGITTRVFHKSGQWMESCTFLNREHANMQGFGGEITYKRRYALSALLGIVSDDDHDAGGGADTKKNGDVKASIKLLNATKTLSGLNAAWASEVSKFDPASADYKELKFAAAVRKKELSEMVAT